MSEYQRPMSEEEFEKVVAKAERNIPDEQITEEIIAEVDAAASEELDSIINNSLEAVDIPLTEIKPYPNNPRKNDDSIPVVMGSIRKYGFKVPIILDKDMVIVAGHTRFEAAKLLKLKTVPCIIASDLTDQECKELRLVDNKTSELSHWDFEMLESELATISTDLSEFGFGEMQDYLDSLDMDDIPDLEDDEDAYQEPAQTFLECPMCHHRDFKHHFKSIKSDNMEDLE